ncbi:MAG: transglycosylase domain-containing protein [Treponema sp.]|nr:transglycosylase domain-containing protein [Treponema sp.]
MVLFTAGLFWAVFRGILSLLPYPELAAYQSRSYGTLMYDRNGRALRFFPAADGVKREWASLDGIPAGVIRVFLRAEDRRFYLHPGFDPLSVAGSALRNLRAGRIVSGASTITMQLARLLRPHTRGLSGKLSEAWDALRLEARLSKREILELYLNGIPFGSNIEGLPAMTRARFGRSISRLDDARSALLAVIPRRPQLYDPARNPDACVAAALLLSKRCGLNLEESALRQAAAEAAETVYDTAGSESAGDGTAREYQKQAAEMEKTPFFAPHFTERVYLMLDAAGSVRPSVLTSLDRQLQSYAETQLQAELTALVNNRVSNGAIMAIENRTGAVLIYAGSVSWFNDDVSGKIDGVRVLNQPGSCLKPFLYAKALDSGFSPADILPDIATVFGSGEAYVPANFNRRFNGPVRFRIALASSLNIPAVYLLERIGVRSFEDYLIALGFDSIGKMRGNHGVGLALGNAEVSLEEMVRAFSVFPRGGSLPELKWFADEAPSCARDPAQTGEQVMSAYAAWEIADILSDRSSRFVGFGPAPSLVTPFPAMFKTGTANQFQHIWALGASSRFTVGVWLGNFSGETVIGRTGSSIPARIASHLLQILEDYDGSPEQSPDTANLPQYAAHIAICPVSGMAAGPFCTGSLHEWILPSLVPRTCAWHRPDGGIVYPPEYQAWLRERFRMGRSESGNAGIRLPVPGSVFYRDPGLPDDAQALRLETAGFMANALVYMDGILQGSLNPAGVFALSVFKGRHTVLVEDENNNRASVEFEVK